VPYVVRGRECYSQIQVGKTYIVVVVVVVVVCTVFCRQTVFLFTVLYLRSAFGGGDGGGGGGGVGGGGGGGGGVCVCVCVIVCVCAVFCRQTVLLLTLIPWECFVRSWPTLRA